MKMCLDELSPHLEDTELKMTFFKFLHIILLNRSKFFFTNTTNEYLPKILNCFNQSFQQHDIALFKQNLEFLQSQNETQKLYQKIFGSALFEFIKTFFGVLLAKTHNLLRDEIVIAIYHMAAVDFTTFYNQFIPQYLEQSPLNNSHKVSLQQILGREQDLPTFAMKVDQFVNDFIH